MQPIRPVIIRPQSPSSWGSCMAITPNLERAYIAAVGKPIESVEFGRGFSGVDTLRAAHEIREKNPTHLIFPDHQSHPLELFIALETVYKTEPWPTLICHLFGDFTLYTPYWWLSQNLLKNKPVQLVCASERQRAFVGSFLSEGKKSTWLCPFPIAEDEFGYDPLLRESGRKKYLKTPDEFLVVYTGRLSLQKNILRTVWEVAENSRAAGIPFRFLLAGSFDDMGHPFFGLTGEQNGYFRGYMKLLEQLPKELRSRIESIGQLGKTELKELYSAADLFLSLSTHHDEDYGMSPIEALACGAPALISDWGGYAGFALDSSVRLLPARLSPTGAIVDTSGFGEALVQFFKKRRSESDATRSKRSFRYLSEFGIAAAAARLKTLLEKNAPPFRGFSNRLERHALLLAEMEETGHMFRPGEKIDGNYREFYRHYCPESAL